MWVIAKKELLIYFTTGSTYLIAALFLLVCGLLLWVMDNPFNIFILGKASLEHFFELAPWLLIFLVPALSMGTIADEWNNGTLEWLFTQPIKIVNIVWGKFTALKVLLLFILFPTLIYIYSIYKLSIPTGSTDVGHLLTGYLGIFLLGVLFSAIGIFCSSLTKNQLIAYLLGLFFCFFLFYGIKGLATYNILNQNDYWVRKLGIAFHYDNFVRGILDTRSIFYFSILSLIFLIWANLNISKKRQ